MRVLQVNNRLEYRGGADIVFIEQSEKLRTLGHEVSRLYVATPKTILKGSNFDYKVSIYFNQSDSLFKRVIKFPLFFFNPFAFNQALRAIREFRPDIIHYHLYKGELTWGVVLAGRLSGVNLVLTSHDYGLVDPHNLLLDGRAQISLKTLKNPFWSVVDRSNRNSFLLSFLSYLEYKLEHFFIDPKKNFNAIICVSNFQKWIYASSHLNLDSNIELISNFSRLETVNVDSQRDRYYLYAGRISAEKGIFEIIEVFSKLEGFKLKIVGDDTYASLHSHENIDWVGTQNGEDLAMLMRGAFYVIVPSICHENNSLTILESLSLGTPVICSDYGGSPEMVINYKTGFTFSYTIDDNLKDTILLSNNISRVQYSKLSCNARQHYEEKYSRSIHFMKLLNVYNKLLNEK